MATTASEMFASLVARDRAPSQGGVIEGSNPSKYNPKEPIVLFIIQVSEPLLADPTAPYPQAKQVLTLSDRPA